MRRVLTIALVLLPLAAHAQHTSQLNLSSGATAIAPLGLFAQAAYEYPVSGACGIEASAAYSLRSVGVATVTDAPVSNVYSRLSTLGLSMGVSFHAINADKLYPYMNAGLQMLYRLNLTSEWSYDKVEVDRVFPMVYAGLGLRQPLGNGKYLGVGGRIEIAPPGGNHAANMLMFALEWGTAL